jgi:hypothetical protein
MAAASKLTMLDAMFATERRSKQETFVANYEFSDVLAKTKTVTSMTASTADIPAFGKLILFFLFLRALHIVLLIC